MVFILKKKIQILFFSFIFPLIKTVTIYQCQKYWTQSGHCLNKWIDSFGNTRIDLSRCGVNKFCQPLNRIDDRETMGICTYNFKRLYSGDICDLNIECSSMVCKKSKCVGLGRRELCTPGRFQCQDNLVCRRQWEKFYRDSYRNVYRCSNISYINESCEYNHECDAKLVCSNYLNITDLIDIYYNPKNPYNKENPDQINETLIENIYKFNITKNDSIIYDEVERNKKRFFNLSQIKDFFNYNDYLKIINERKNNKICINRAALNNGTTTWEAMACKTGDFYQFEIFPGYNESFCVSKKEVISDCDLNKKCKVLMDLGNFGEVEVEEDCIYTTRGNLHCPLNKKENEWKNYLQKYNRYYTFYNIDKNREEKNFHIPVYKDTFNDYSLSEAFWRYNEWYHTLEADSCTYYYFFLQNYSIKIFVSWKLLIHLVIFTLL